MLGDGLYYLIILFMADKAAKGDAGLVGLVGFAQAVPFLIFGPIAGRAADRYDRRMIMVWSDFASGLVTAGLALYAVIVPLPNIWALAAVGFLLSSINSFFMPARTAAIPNLVEGEALMEANSLIVSTQQIVFMMAHAFSLTVLGALFKASPHIAFPLAAAMNAITFLVSALFILGLPKLQPSLEGRETAGAWQEVVEGLKAIKSNHMMLPALAVSSVCQLFISGWMVCYLATNREWFGGEFWTLALFELTFFAVLAVSSLMVGRMKLKKIGWAFSLSWISTGLLCALMVLGEKSFHFYVLMNALCGITVAFAWLPMATYIQAAFEDEVRGRVSATWNMINMGIQPFGYAIAGGLIKAMGIGGMYLFMGLGMAGSALLGLAFKGMRQAQMPESAFAKASES